MRFFKDKLLLLTLCFLAVLTTLNSKNVVAGGDPSIKDKKVVQKKNKSNIKQHDHDKDRSAKPENPAEPNQFGDNSGSKKNRGHNYGQMHKHSHEHVHQHVHKHVHQHVHQHQLYMNCWVI